MIYNFYINYSDIKYEIQKILISEINIEENLSADNLDNLDNNNIKNLINMEDIDYLEQEDIIKFTKFTLIWHIVIVIRGLIIVIRWRNTIINIVR